MFISKPNKIYFQDLTDDEIINKILISRTAKYQGVLYDRYVDRIYYKCLGILKDRNLAKDLTHDTMIKVFCKLHTFQGKSDFSFWVNAIAYNTCMSFLRHKKKERFGVTEICYDMEKAATEKENRVLRELKLEQLVQCFDLLGVADKIILLLFYRDNFSIQKIAYTLNIRLSATKMRLLRSKKRLVQLMSPIKETADAFANPEERIFDLYDSFKSFDTPTISLELLRA